MTAFVYVLGVCIFIVIVVALAAIDRRTGHALTRAFERTIGRWL